MSGKNAFLLISYYGLNILFLLLESHRKKILFYIQSHHLIGMYIFLYDGRLYHGAAVNIKLIQKMFRESFFLMSSIFAFPFLIESIRSVESEIFQ